MREVVILKTVKRHPSISMDLAEDFYTAIKGVENQVGMQITNLGSDQSYKLLEMIFNREKSTEKNISA